MKTVFHTPVVPKTTSQSLNIFAPDITDIYRTCVLSLKTRKLQKVDASALATPPQGELLTAKANATPRIEIKGEFELPLVDIQRVEKFLVRLKRNEQTVADYAELFTDYKEEMARNKKAKYPFPPITVWYDESGLCVLLAGDHRSAAALMAGLVTIRATVFHGTEREAYMFACKDNAENALPMGRGDKYAITKALLMFPDKSLDYFVQELKCGKTTVSELRTELFTTGQLARPEGVVGKDGKTYTLTPQSGKQSGKSTPKKAPPAKGVPVKSLAERKAYTYEYLENLIDDMPEQEGADFLEEFIKRCEYMYNYRAGIAKSNNVPQATDQSAKAT